jgi:hypothetical protein
MDIGHFIVLAIAAIMIGATFLAWALSRAADDQEENGQ